MDEKELINEDDQETGDLSPPMKKMKKSSPKSSPPVVGMIVSYGLCYQEWLDDNAEEA
jgi:hypothetical protein